MYGGICLCLVKRVLIWLMNVKACDVMSLMCGCNVRCVSSVTPRIFCFVCLVMFVFCRIICGYVCTGVFLLLV